MTGILVWRKFLAVGVSAAVQLVPFAIWLVFLRWYGLAFYDGGAQDYGSGVWLVQDLIHRNPFEIAGMIRDSMAQVFVLSARYYSALILAASAAMILPEVRRALRGEGVVFLLTLCVLLWLQMFAGRFYRPDLTSDLAFAVFGLSACAVTVFTRRYHLPRLRTAFVAVYAALSILSLVRFPWVAPEHQGVSASVSEPTRTNVDVKPF